MKIPLRFVLCLIALALGGCLPEERFWWAPDGSQAAVVVNGQLHLARADGELGEALVRAEGSAASETIRVSWLRDGSGMVVHRLRKLAQWDEVRALIPPEEALHIERLATTMPDFLKSAAVLMMDADSLVDLLAGLAGQSDEMVSSAFFCAYEKQKPAVEAALLAGTKGATMLETVRRETAPFKVHEIGVARLSGDRLDGEVAPLARSIHTLLQPAVSPKFPVAAYWRRSSRDETLVLEVCALDGQRRIEAARSRTATFDWSADGRSLIFAVPAAGDDALLQMIRRVTVLQESGALLEPRREAGDATLQPLPATTLALAILPSPPRLAVLPDGRLLFAGAPATLPAVGQGLRLEPRLFVIAADGQSMTQVPTAPGDLPADLSSFAVSPDGRLVAVVERDTDAVAVVELATGRTEIVSPAHPQWQCRTLPAWKSATELTFAALDVATSGPRWVLWQQGAGIRSLSDRWPAASTRGWLSQKPSGDTLSASPESSRKSP